MTRRVLKLGEQVEYMEFAEGETRFFRRTFHNAQDCADWIEQERPGEVVEWRLA